MITIHVKPRASAKAFLGVLSNASKTIDVACGKQAKFLATEAHKAVVKGIQGQAFAVAALNNEYLAWKGRHGLSAGVLEATKGYQRAARVVQVGPRTWGIDLVGSSPFTGVPYATVMRWLERGNKKMKPRPHWEPAIEQTMATKVGMAGQSITTALFSGK